MKKTHIALLITLMTSGSAYSEIDTELGTANLDLRLRYETVDQDNALKDANALILRTTANFKTVNKQGFYGFVELENSLAFIDDYNDTNGRGAGYSVIADPESTELDQAYLGYRQDGLSVKIGRQSIKLDSQRHVGDVAWRNDKQTFDALSASYSVSNKTKVTYAYINKRNRIFADEKDVDSKDHLFNASIKLPSGKLTGYAYMLEVDNGSNNALDTYGVRYAGRAKGVSYIAEFALQSNQAAEVEYDTTYTLLEASTKISSVSVKAGYESLGSDNGNKAFATPLATLHKFNGWADQFLATPNQGLNELYIKLGGKVGSGKWFAAYHSYSANQASAGVDDLGSEINLQYTTKLSDFPVGIRYAAYSAGDIKIDTNKLWLWTSYNF